MFSGNFEKNVEYRKQLDELGYKGVSLWNILIDLKNKTLNKKVLENIARQEKQIQEYQIKHGNIGRYQREFKILAQMKTDLAQYKEEHYNNNLLEPINMALDDLYYSQSIETRNKCYKVAIKFIKENIDIKK